MSPYLPLARDSAGACASWERAGPEVVPPLGNFTAAGFSRCASSGVTQPFATPRAPVRENALCRLPCRRCVVSCSCMCLSSQLPSRLSEKTRDSQARESAAKSIDAENGRAADSAARRGPRGPRGDCVARLRDWRAGVCGAPRRPCGAPRRPCGAGHGVRRAAATGGAPPALCVWNRIIGHLF